MWLPRSEWVTSESRYDKTAFETHTSLAVAEKKNVQVASSVSFVSLYLLIIVRIFRYMVQRRHTLKMMVDDERLWKTRHGDGTLSTVRTRGQNRRIPAKR